MANDHLDVVLSERAGLVATGRTMDGTVEVSGGAWADVATLSVDTMSVAQSEGTTATPSVSEELTGIASGGGVASVAGGAVLNVQTSGGASVTRK